MKFLKKLSKLEKLLFSIIGFIVLIFALFLISKTFVAKKYHLRYRYEQYARIIENSDFSKAYNYYSSSYRNEHTLDDYLEKRADLSDNNTQNVTVNKIVIDEDKGYVDRTNEVCEDKDCFALRGYRKWVYEGNNWYYDPPSPYCVRKERYDMPQEFIRALSLLEQRYSEWYDRGGS